MSHFRCQKHGPKENYTEFRSGKLRKIFFNCCIYDVDRVCLCVYSLHHIIIFCSVIFALQLHNHSPPPPSYSLSFILRLPPFIIPLALLSLLLTPFFLHHSSHSFLFFTTLTSSTHSFLFFTTLTSSTHFFLFFTSIVGRAF